MNVSNDVKQAIANFENRGYEKTVNPVSQQVQVRKACQVQFLKFKSVDKEGAPVFTSREGSDVLSTPVLCQIQNSTMQVTATLHKKSYDSHAVVPNGVYSCMITNVLTPKGKNTLSATSKSSYFTMFSSAGNSVSSDDLESLGL
tara:strand:+ start:104 stop:535 length:432 start_codon:yes stop_codon:yes gene_type:complete